MEIYNCFAIEFRGVVVGVVTTLRLIFLLILIKESFSFLDHEVFLEIDFDFDKSDIDKKKGCLELFKGSGARKSKKAREKEIKVSDQRKRARRLILIKVLGEKKKRKILIFEWL